MVDGQNNILDYVTWRDLSQREDLIVQKIDRVAERHSAELYRALSEHEARSQKSFETTLKNFGHEVVKMFQDGQREDQERIRSLENRVTALQEQIVALKEAQKDGPDDEKAGTEQGALGMMRAAATGQNGGAAMFMGVSFLVFTLTIILVVPESRHLLFNIFT